MLLDCRLVLGTRDNDILVGTSACDVIGGCSGNDVITGLGGNDILIGDAGADRFGWWIRWHRPSLELMPFWISAALMMIAST